MISLQTGPRASLGSSARDDAAFQVKLEPSSSSLSVVPFKGRDSHHEGELSVDHFVIYLCLHRFFEMMDKCCVIGYLLSLCLRF